MFKQVTNSINILFENKNSVLIENKCSEINIINKHKILLILKEMSKIDQSENFKSSSIQNFSS